MLAHGAQHGRLQPLNEKFQVSSSRARGKLNACGIAALGGLLDRRPARVRQAEQAGHLVEGFAGGVVQRAAQAPVAEVVAHQHQLGVPARNEQRQQREARRGRRVLRVGRVEATQAE
jgi:hypothetical protein